MVEVEVYEQDAGLYRVDQLVNIGKRTFASLPRMGDLIRHGKLWTYYEVLAVIHHALETDRPATVIVVRPADLEGRLKK